MTKWKEKRMKKEIRKNNTHKCTCKITSKKKTKQQCLLPFLHPRGSRRWPNSPISSIPGISLRRQPSAFGQKVIPHSLQNFYSKCKSWWSHTEYKSWSHTKYKSWSHTEYKSWSHTKQPDAISSIEQLAI